MHTVAGDNNWTRAATRLARRLFVARILEAWRTPLVVAAAACAVAGLLARMNVFPAWVAPVVCGVAVLAGGIAVQRSVRAGGSGSPREALARLDAALGLHDRLLAAAEGAVAWPPFPAAPPAIVRWRWARVLSAPLLAALVIAAAFVLPVRPAAPPAVPPTEKPPVFGELTALVEELRQSEAAAPAALDQLQQTLDELAARDDAGLYSHGTLEAADNLVDQAAAGAGELAAGLQAAGAALTQMADAADPGATKAAQDALNQALRALQNSRLPPNPALAGGLQHAANGQLSPQQLAELSRNLRNAAHRAGQGTGSTTMNYRQRQGSPSQAAGRRPGTGQPGEPDDGSGFGSGGVERGPGHPPLELASDPAARRDGRETPLESADSDRASLADLVAESAGAPRVDPRTAPATGAGGAFAVPDRAGEAARVDELTPEERRAVRRFFK